MSDVPVADGLGAVFGAGEGAEVTGAGLAGWSAAAVGDGVVEVGPTAGAAAVGEDAVGVAGGDRGAELGWDLVAVGGGRAGGIEDGLDGDVGVGIGEEVAELVGGDRAGVGADYAVRAWTASSVRWNTICTRGRDAFRSARVTGRSVSPPPGRTG